MKSHRSAKPIKIVGAAKPTPCADTLHSLGVAACAGDRNQAQRLLNSAIFAAQMVEQLFKEKPALLCEITQKESQVPVLRSRWWWLNQSREQMVEALQIGEATTPFRDAGFRWDKTSQYIIECLYPVVYYEWQAVRTRRDSQAACSVHQARRAKRAETRKKQKGTAKLDKLPPISKQTAMHWAEAMADIFLSADSDTKKGTPTAYGGTIFQEMSDGLKDLNKRKHKMAGRLAKRHSLKFEEDWKKAEMLKASRVADLKITQTEMYFGFVQRISKRLISMLKE